MPIRILILVGTVVLIGGLFIWFIYIPKSEEITKAKEGIASLQRKLDQAKVRARHLEKFEAELALVDGQFQEALRLLPNEKEIPQLLRTITQLGSDSQLEFRLFRPQREQTKDFFIVIPVSIEVSGSYHNVAVFFDRVGRMERIVNILNVSMKPVQDLSTTLVTNCDAVTYSFKGPSDAGTTKKK
jgi:type IV pilus assembly protein PilO